MKKTNQMVKRVLSVVLSAALLLMGIPMIARTPIGAADSAVLDGESAVTANGILFENQYTATPYELTLEGESVLVGRDLVDGEFEFVLFTENGGGLEKVKNENGTFVFSPIEITAAGTYIYRVAEAAGTDETVTYDETVYTVTVKIVDNGEGALVLDGDIVIDGGEAIVFTNIYTEPPVEEPPVNTGDCGYAPTAAMVAVAGGLFVVTLLGGKRRREHEE